MDANHGHAFVLDFDFNYLFVGESCVDCFNYGRKLPDVNHSHRPTPL